jgi:DNA-binding NarL/FixJ family response regulator
MPRPSTALIVDDEPHVVVLLRAILKELGVTTIWDADGEAGALEKAAANNPGVVLLDLNLPQVDGLQVLSKLKEKHPALPVIIVSAQSTLRTFDRAKELGARAYVLKYGAKADVLRQISEALDAISGEASPSPQQAGEAPVTS